MKFKLFWHRLAYRIATLSAGAFFHSFVRVRVTGRENLPSHGPFLLVCNHISHFDPPILASVIPHKVAWVVALDMYASRVGRAYFTAIESISVDRKGTDRLAARGILKRFKRGEIVGLFPEGGIRAGAASVLEGAPMDDAVGGLAHLGGVPVVPAVIIGTDKLYAWRAWLWKTTVDIRFGKPIKSECNAERGVRSAEMDQARAGITGQAMKEMQNLVEELKGKFHLQEEDLPKTPQERWRETKG